MQVPETGHETGTTQSVQSVEKAENVQSSVADARVALLKQLEAGVMLREHMQSTISAVKTLDQLSHRHN